MRSFYGMDYSSLLNVRDVSVFVGEKQLLKNVFFSLERGEWLMICGPNGAGKSTLFSVLNSAISKKKTFHAPYYRGDIELEGKKLSAYSSKERAKKIAFLSQQNNAFYAFSVRELVSLGRYAWKESFFGTHSKKDDEIIDEVLSFCGLLDLQDRSITTVSGGELQRAFLAQAFVQEPHILVLDEPANHLDLLYQKEIFSLLSRWIKKDDRAVISVVHDLSMAKKYGSKALLLDGGNLVCSGSTNSVLNERNLNNVYGLSVSRWMKELLRVWEE